MRVPFVNYPLQYSKIKTEIDFAFNKILCNGDLIFREDLQKLEKDIAKYCGVKYGISCDSCTGGMFLSLKALGIKAGDEVITVSHTYIATIDVIKACGATPILIDVNKQDHNMNVDLLEGAITAKTKAIIPVHLNGRLCNMEKIMEIAQKHNLFVVEDAAQALGASLNGKRAGSFGNTGCFSFYPAKMLGSFGDGGMIITDDFELAKKLYLLRDHCELPGYLSHLGDGVSKKIYGFGYNSILDNMQAAFLNVKLKHFNNWIIRRREIAKIYHAGLSHINELTLMPAPNKGPYFDVFQNYVVRTKKRDELKSFLEEKSIETLVSWRVPNHKQENLQLDHFNLPETESISNEVISLPMYPELSNEKIEIVIEAISEFYK
jgi:dTDP-4-amino-4,6-dideoxygalactose transaminase